MGLCLSQQLLLVSHQDGAGHPAQEPELLLRDFPAAHLLKVDPAVALVLPYLRSILEMLGVLEVLLLMRMAAVALLALLLQQVQVPEATVALERDDKAAVVAVRVAQLLALAVLAVLVDSRLVVEVAVLQ